jgi:hypothetical protein
MILIELIGPFSFCMCDVYYCLSVLNFRVALEVMGVEIVMDHGRVVPPPT